MDGLSFKEGSGTQLHEMTAREAINVAYAHLIRDMREEDRAARTAGHKFEETLEERIVYFEEKIGLRPSHDDLALWMHRNVLLPSKGYTKEQIDEMFDEGASATLPKGVREEDRWRFEDMEWDGLADFQGNPWELPGMEKIRAQHTEEDREKAAEEARDTL